LQQYDEKTVVCCWADSVTNFYSEILDSPCVPAADMNSAGRGPTIRRKQMFRSYRWRQKTRKLWATAAQCSMHLHAYSTECAEVTVKVCRRHCLGRVDATCSIFNNWLYRFTV